MSWLRARVMGTAPQERHVSERSSEHYPTCPEPDPHEHAREVQEARERLQRLRDEIDIRARETDR